MDPENANRIIGELADIVARDNLIQNPTELSEYAAAPGLPLAVVFPENKAQVCRIVRAAGTHGTALIPVSSPAHASVDMPEGREAVIVDFSRMKKIFKIDADSRYAWIEPGVTYGELIPALNAHGMRPNASFLPRPAKSVVASLLEREPVLIPKYHYDYTDPLLTLEVVYGTGDDFRTGSASGPGPLEHLKADKVNPWGPGSVDYMRFLTGAQGTMGLVTWAVVKTEILPSLRKLFFIGAEDLKPLTGLAGRLLAKRVPDECLILNSVNLAAILSGDEAEHALLKTSLPRWTLLVCLSGYERYPEERVRIQETYLNELCAGFGLDAETSLTGAAGKEGTIPDYLSGCWEGDIYWKNRFGGGCRDIFFLSPVSRAASLTDILFKAADGARHPEGRIGAYIQPLVQGRGCHVEFNLFYDECDASRSARPTGCSWTRRER
jgi:hypothetical protein